MPYRVLLFDLFRTVILFTPQAPTGQVKEPHWRSAMSALQPEAANLLPRVGFDDLLDAIVAATEEIARSRPPEYRETPVAERYRRALARVGCNDPDAPAIAEWLSLLQMAALSANAYLPAAHRELLQELAHDHRLGLVTNFDHGPTVHQLLAREGLDGVFGAMVISIEFGRRKPHPAIFGEALRRLDAAPAEALFIGDSPFEDIGGARAAGLDVAWLNAAAQPLPPGLPGPTYVIAQLTDLRAILGAGCQGSGAR